MATDEIQMKQPQRWFARDTNGEGVAERGGEGWQITGPCSLSCDQSPTVMELRPRKRRGGAAGTWALSPCFLQNTWEPHPCVSRRMPGPLFLCLMTLGFQSWGRVWGPEIWACVLQGHWICRSRNVPCNSSSALNPGTSLFMEGDPAGFKEILLGWPFVLRVLICNLLLDPGGSED
jgi:hypothetical protein